MICYARRATHRVIPSLFTSDAHARRLITQLQEALAETRASLATAIGTVKELQAAVDLNAKHIHKLRGQVLGGTRPNDKQLKLDGVETKDELRDYARKTGQLHS